MFKVILAVCVGLSAGMAFCQELIHATATLSVARSDLAATSVGNLALFAGGHGESGFSDVVDIYNAEEGTWSTAVLSEARPCPAAVSVGNLAIFAGGIFVLEGHLDSLSGNESKACFASSVVDIYDADTGMWSSATLSQSGAPVAAAVGTKAFFAMVGSNMVDVYDAQTGLWSTATLSQPRRYSIAATSVGNKVLFAGPVSESGSDVVVDIYDHQTGVWSTDIIPEAENLSSVAVTVGDKAMFLQGDIVYVYDDTLGEWSTETLSEFREKQAGTAMDGKALFAGGLRYFDWPWWDGDGFIGGDDLDMVRCYWGQQVAPNSWGDVSGDGFVGGDDLDWLRAHWLAGRIQSSTVMDVYDNDTGMWSVDAISQARQSLAATAMDDAAFFAGGLYDGIYSNVVDIYTPPLDVPRAVAEPSTVVLLFMGGLAFLGLTRIWRKRRSY